MTADVTVDRTLDVKGTLCPLPVVRTSKTIREMGAGEVLEVLATDPGSKPDITAWARRTGNEVLSVEEEGEVFRFYVRKG